MGLRGYEEVRGEEGEGSKVKGGGEVLRGYQVVS